MAEQKAPVKPEETKAVTTKLSQASERYLATLMRQFENHGITFDDYSKVCAMHAVAAINTLLDKSGLDFNGLDQSNAQSILETVAVLKLNASAQPREVYFIIRKEKKAEQWISKIEMGIEGDGNDAILRNFGVDVKRMYPHWIVRSEDIFEYPKHKGLELTPPIWEETGKGHVERIVYPIAKADGAVDYYIGEREDVRNNLLAHIRNNMMNETFGLAKSKYDATPDQKKKIDEKKAEILKKAKEKGFEVLSDPEFESYLSPAWLDATEAMIIRKIRNNIVKKIPKNFGDAYVQEVYETATDETYRAVKAEIAEFAGKETIDITPENMDKETGEVIEPPAPKAKAGQQKMEPEF